MSSPSKTTSERLEVEPEATALRPDSARSRASDEQIRSSACGSAIEINYDEDVEPTVVPFFPEWAFGSRLGGRVLNLSFGGRGLLAYCCAHAVVLYDYKTHAQRLLLGHRNGVSSIASDSRGAWLVSVDVGTKLEPSCVILWNLKDASMQRALPGEHPEQGYHLVSMSCDGELVAAVSASAAGPSSSRASRPSRPCRVFLWRCQTDAASRPDAVLELPASLGAANALAFCDDAPNCFMVTCDRNVAFLAWTGTALQLQVGQLITKCPGKLVGSIYQRGTTNAITVSAKGFVIFWTDPLVYAPNAKISREVYCIEKDGLTAITEVDGMVAIGTRRGHIRFYDQHMCLLHWYQQAQLDAIVSLSFHLDAPTADGKPDLSWVGSRCSFPTAGYSCNKSLRCVPPGPTSSSAMTALPGPARPGPGRGLPAARLSVDAEQRGVQDRVDLSRLISGPSPRGAHADQDAFQARDLIVSTAAGRLVLVSFANARCVILQDNQDVVTTIQTHPEKPLLLIGKANGTISAIDYVKKEVAATHTFERKAPSDPVAVTSLCYSANGLALACGRANGTLYLLHPVLLHPIVAQPFRRTHHSIQHLCFSPDNMFMAHCDSANFVSAYRCQNAALGRWVYLGKKQLHGLPIRSVLFGPQPFDAPLFSLGEDLVLVEYDVAHSMNNSLFVTRMDRVEQSGVPSCVTWCPGESADDDLLLLIATSEFKYKLVNLKTRQLCGTAQGPRLRTPVSIIQTIGGAVGAAGQSAVTALYVTERRLGLQRLPPDGNPFRNAAIMCHPVMVSGVAVSSCEQFVFSCGAQDHGVVMWRINPEALDVLHADDEPGLRPWLLSVEGGREGWLLGTLQDMFCSAQLLHQGACSTEPHRITDRLPVCELPDVMRALGFFPSQFEINTMVSEVLRRHGESISLTDLVKLYVNYKPVHGMGIEELREAFSVFAYPTKGADGSAELVMTKEKFLSVLLDKGEAMDMAEAASVLSTLLKGAAAVDADSEGLYSHLLMDELAQREKMFYYLPDTITFSFFMDTILGVVRK